MNYYNEDCQDVALRAAYIEGKAAEYSKRHGAMSVPSKETIKGWIKGAFAHADTVLAERGGECSDTAGKYPGCPLQDGAK
jgi:hypothetical protein